MIDEPQVTNWCPICISKDRQIAQLTTDNERLKQLIRAYINAEENVGGGNVRECYADMKMAVERPPAQEGGER